LSSIPVLRQYLTHRQGQFSRIFPLPSTESENVVLCIKGIGIYRPFSVLLISLIPEYQFLPNGVFSPLCTYSQDGNTRQENITDWALEQYQTQYKDSAISKKDIFYYVYGILHHPFYREKYAANLKRELPRIPFTPDFWAFSRAGKQLAELHVNYEKQPEYKLTWIEEETTKVHYRVGRTTLSKDKTQIIYNDFLTLGGIPPETFEYRLGNRSALEWIIDQYQVSTDKRSGITNDPNKADDPQYIVRLIGKVITVSLETVKIVKSLPELELASSYAEMAKDNKQLARETFEAQREVVPDW
jgi:predicted helicase